MTGWEYGFWHKNGTLNQDMIARAGRTYAQVTPHNTCPRCISFTPWGVATETWIHEILFGGSPLYKNRQWLERSRRWTSMIPHMSLTWLIRYTPTAPCLLRSTWTRMYTIPKVPALFCKHTYIHIGIWRCVLSHLSLQRLFGYLKPWWPGQVGAGQQDHSQHLPPEHGLKQRLPDCHNRPSFLSNVEFVAVSQFWEIFLD